MLERTPVPLHSSPSRLLAGQWVPVVSPAGEEGEAGVEPTRRPRRPLGRSFSVGDSVQ